MKKCPFCKADIQDNARFCLYCMKPLNEKEVITSPEKKKRWWPLALVLAVVLMLAALLLVVMLQPRERADMPTDTTGGESTSTVETTKLQTDETTAETTRETRGGGSAWQEEPTTQEDSPTSEPTNGNQNTQKPEVKPTKPEEPTENASTPTEEESVEETTESTTVATTQATTPPQKDEAKYTYRAARAGDDFSANYTNAGNDIVITGIAQSSADGVYDIPTYIDGKKVIGIVANAFSGSNAKRAYVPATVRTIWNYAFTGCGLTDIYFRGNAIYAEGFAFPSGIVIHCSASCSDRNFRYYKNSAANYGATWVEWNG